MLRASAESRLFSNSIGKVLISDIEISFNDYDYFDKYPFAAFTAPCLDYLEGRKTNNAQKNLERADMLKRMMFVTYVKYSINKGEEIQETAFVYLCKDVCEIRELTIGDNLGLSEDFAQFAKIPEYDYPDSKRPWSVEMLEDRKQLFTWSFERRLGFKESPNFSADAYDVTRFFIKVDHLHRVVRVVQKTLLGKIDLSLAKDIDPLRCWSLTKKKQIMRLVLVRKEVTPVRVMKRK